ncbi:MAG: glycosyltransferase family 4 protein [Pyrinomonadaceae bacterium]
MIKVLHILDSLNRGGAETMMLDVCRNARANGLDLTFVATGGGDLENEFRDSGVEFIRLKRKLPVDLALALELRRIIAEHGIRVVHSHQPVEALHLYLATRGSDTKKALTLHGVYPGTKNELALRFVLPRIDAKIAVSQNLLQELQANKTIAGENCFLINNGVDPARLQSAGRKLRTELGLQDDALLLGMVGNFQPVALKDQLTVCRALPDIFARVPQAQFIFAGARSAAAPELFDECVELCRREGIDHRVHFLGKRTDIADVLSSLDVFVLSSLREGSPISVIEAMMAGVPTVLSDIPALREVSNEGEQAVLFRTGDRDDLAAKLAALVNDSEERQRLASNARQWARESFGIDRHIADLVRLYDSLVSSDALPLANV